MLRARPLEELRTSCAAARCMRLGRNGNSDDCARFLAASSFAGGEPGGHGSDSAEVQPRPRPTPQVPQVQQAAAAATASRRQSKEANAREQTAADEVARIAPLVREAFPSQAAWGFSVLGISETEGVDVLAVRSAYRALMKKLHPDRVGQSAAAARAIESLREARDCCERALSRLEPPGPPRNLAASLLVTMPGSRRVRLQWEPPEAQEAAPVRRYLVAAVDPAYGRALTVATLEPDYREELGRYVSVEELCSHTLVEEALQKMPSLFRQPFATLQVAAANEAGTSPWATLRVSLAETAASSRRSGVAHGGAAAHGANAGLAAAAESAAAATAAASHASHASNDVGARGKASEAAPPAANIRDFETQLRARAAAASASAPAARARGGHGAGSAGSAAGATGRSASGGGVGGGGAAALTLKAWLGRQSKALLAAWLKSRSWPGTGSKEDLIERVEFAVCGGAGRRGA